MAGHRRVRAGAALIVVGAIAAAATAHAADVVLENVVTQGRGGWMAQAPRVEVFGTNLSKDELAALLKGPGAGPAAATLRRLTADKIAIPDMTLTGHGVSVAFHDLRAQGVAAGRMASASVQGFNGSLTGDLGEAHVRSGPLALEDANLVHLLDVAEGADMASGALSVGALSWTDAAVEVPGAGASAAAPYKFSLGSLKTQSAWDGDAPGRSSGEATHMVFEPPAGSDIGRNLKALGYDRIDAGLTFTGAYDKAAKSFTIADYTIAADRAGAVSVGAKFNGVDPIVFSGGKEEKRVAMLRAALSAVTVHVRDEGLLSKLADTFAVQAEKTSADVRAEWSALASSLIPLFLSGAPSANAVAMAVSQFLTSGKPLTISAKPKGAAPTIAALRDMRPPQVLSVIELTATTGP